MTNDRVWMARLEGYAEDIAGYQLDNIERELQRNPDAHLEFTSAASRLKAVEAQFDWASDPRLTELSEAWIAHSAALAVEMYLQGVRDGGRIYHAFITGELPRKEEPK